ncbi:hypothetical protein ACLB2K_048582 [Fragaria x ananassa]
MAMNSLLHLPKPHFPPTFPTHPKPQTQLSTKSFTQYGTLLHDPKTMVGLLGAGLTLTLTLTVMAPASAAGLPLLDSLQLSEPANALSLPTWAIHVSSVVEWITAMVLVWQYGEKSGFESWKGLAWGMVDCGNSYSHKLHSWDPKSESSPRRSDGLVGELYEELAL